MLVGQAVALEAFKARALMLCSTLDRLAVALEALVALALMLSSMMGLISLALALLLEEHAATACHTFYLEGVLRFHKIKLAFSSSCSSAERACPDLHAHQRSRRGNHCAEVLRLLGCRKCCAALSRYFCAVFRGRQLCAALEARAQMPRAWLRRWRSRPLRHSRRWH